MQQSENKCVVIIEYGESDSLVVPNYYIYMQEAMSSDVLLLCGALKSWHAEDHINEDLQLERSGRVGPVAARKLTASSSRVNG